MTEYRYNGLGYQIAEHADTNGDSDVDSNDLWYYNAFDERWRKLATFRSSDTDPKEEFVPHQAGLDGAGTSSYINGMVLRDKDDSGPWTDASDGVLEQRMFYLNNWRGDVVAMVTSTGYQAEMVRYSAYGTPFGYPGGDCNEDGIANGADRTVIIGWIAASTYDVRGDLDLDGDVDSTDSAVFASNYTGTTTGWGVLSAGGNEVGYAGMMWFDSGRYLARHRWHDPELGRWERRDPMGYRDGLTLVEYASASPIRVVDSHGLFGQTQAPLAGSGTPPPTPGSGTPLPIQSFPVIIVGKNRIVQTGVTGTPGTSTVSNPGGGGQDTKIKLDHQGTNSGYFLGAAWGSLTITNCSCFGGKKKDCAVDGLLGITIDPVPGSGIDKTTEWDDWHKDDNGAPAAPKWSAEPSGGDFTDQDGVPIDPSLGTGTSQIFYHVDVSLACATSTQISITVSSPKTPSIDLGMTVQVTCGDTLCE
jgi:RHS repeat-associated protein